MQHRGETYAPDEETLRTVRRHLGRSASCEGSWSVDGVSEADLARTVGAVLYSILGQMADNSIVERAGAPVEISDGASFVRDVGQAFARSFGEAPTEGRSLADAIHKDLLRFVSRGGLIAGPWGSVGIAGNGRMSIFPRSEATAHLDRVRPGSSGG